MVHEEGAHGMIAKRIAFGPVVDIPIDPPLKSRQVFRNEGMRNPIKPVGGNKRLLAEFRAEQLFAKGEELSLFQCFDLLEMTPGDLPDERGLNAVILYVVFKKTPKALLRFGIRMVRKLFSNSFQKKGH